MSSIDKKDDKLARVSNGSQETDLDVVNGQVGELRGEPMAARYSLFTMLALYFGGSGGWEGPSGSLFQVVVAGGPTGLVWSYIMAGFFGVCCAAAIAEFASLWPGAGATYHWTLHLCPPKFRRQVGWTMSYLCLYMIIMQTLVAGFTGALQVQSVVMLGVDSYNPQRWHVYLLFVAMTLVAFAVNLFVPRMIHHLSMIILCLHTIGLVGITATLFATTNHYNSASLVFGNLVDSTGWQDKGICFLVGMLPSSTSFIGVQMAGHWSEETDKPTTDIPRAIVWGTVTNAITGFPFILAMAFCMGDPSEIVNDPLVATSPLAALIVRSSNSNVAAIALCSVLTAICFIGGVFCIGMSSRIMAAAARDSALSFEHFLSRIHPRWNVPMNAMATSVVIVLLLGVIYVGNTTAFFSISSGAVLTQTLTVIVPIVFHIARYWNGGLEYGPWRLPVWLRWTVNVIGAAGFSFIVVAIIIPSRYPVTAENMNYSTTLLGACFILSTVLWFVFGRDRYKEEHFKFTEEYAASRKVTKKLIISAA
ncbi:amino acid/polyamine transporter I [Aspergillus karnatakaensis]|uniref:amino acid/polyamine transporter I n=1 Tax=Aspergillus karnatakaensis TaxID=1810916 RepID=UPI003CCCA0B6